MPNLMHTLEDILATVVNSSFLPEINYTIWTKRVGKSISLPTYVMWVNVKFIFFGKCEIDVRAERKV